MKCSKWHMELNENGEGKCSVPMWSMGVPAGFCDSISYGYRSKSKEYRNAYTGKLIRFDGKYSGHVPGLACFYHGGPQYRYHKGDPCIYCDTPHDDIAPGPCPGKITQTTV